MSEQDYFKSYFERAFQKAHGRSLSDCIRDLEAKSQEQEGEVELDSL